MLPGCGRACAAAREPARSAPAGCHAPGLDGGDICRAVRKDPRDPDSRDHDHRREPRRPTESRASSSAPTIIHQAIQPSRGRRPGPRRCAAPPRPRHPTLTFGDLQVDAEQTRGHRGRSRGAIDAKSSCCSVLPGASRARAVPGPTARMCGAIATRAARAPSTCVRRLREKLPVMADAIVTVPQFGYKLRETP